MKINFQNKIITFIFALVVAFESASLFFDFSLAQVVTSPIATPRKIDISAHIINNENKEIENGEYEIRFAVYRTNRETADPYPSSTDARLWEETQKVFIKDGILRAYLGTVSPLPAGLNFASGEYYLGIRIGQDSEMVPRKKIGAVPLAIDALSIGGATVGTAEGNLITLGTGGKVDISLLPTGKSGKKLVLANDSRLGGNETEIEISGSYSYVDASGSELTLNAINLTSDVTGILGIANGGTGIGSYTAGDMTYYSSGNSLSRITIGNAGEVLTVVGGVPVWQPAGSGISGSGMAGHMTYWSGASSIAYDSDGSFYWDATNNRLGIGTTNPLQKLDVSGKIALNGTTVAYLPTNMTGTLILGNGGTNLLSGANHNTFVGLNSGTANTTGYSNTAVGYNSFYSNTTGSSNAAFGENSLYSNTTGYSNAAFGIDSLRYNSEGHQNSAFGKGSLINNITGNYNSAFGTEALQSNNTGYENSAFGFYSLAINTTGYQNSAFGSEALYSNSTGHLNSAFGKGSLFNNTAGDFNAAFGENSLYSNDDGYENSAIGSHALYSNTTGYYNSAIGSYALFSNTTGYENIAFGTDAGSYIYDGSSPNETSSDSVYLGFNTMALASGDTNEIVIGASAIGIGSNTVTLGNDSIVTTALKGNVGIGTTNPIAKLDIFGGNLNIPQTTSASVGVITQNASPVFHTYGTENLFIGKNSGNFTLTNDVNLGIGENTLNSLTTGNVNLAIGKSSLTSDTTGRNNLAIGYEAMRSNQSGNFNVALGQSSLYSTVNASANTAIGYAALQNSASTGSSYNTALGYYASPGQNGIENTSIGAFSGGFNNNTTGLTFLGAYSDTNIANSGYTNSTAVGYYSVVGASNSLILGGTGSYAVNVGIGLIAPTARLDIYGASGDLLNISNSTSSVFKILNNGNVGIGTTNPAQKLDVSGKIALNGTTVAYLPTNLTGTLVLGNGGTNLLSGANYNTFVGLSSGVSNTTGSYNSATGMESLYSNIDGFSNSAMGVGSLYYNTSGYSNSALGRNSLYSNTTGIYNSAMGVSSLYSNTTGSANSAIGMDSLYSNTTGIYNSAVGYDSLYSNTTGNNNSALGMSSGRFISGGGANATSNNSVYLGYDTRALADGDTNEIVIGASATGIGSNTVTLGNDSIVTTALKGNVGIGTTAPGYKLDVQGGYANASSGLCINGDCITSWSDGGVGQTYTAGNDLNLTGTQFDIESQLDYVSIINRTSADLTLQTTTSGNIILNPAGNVGIGTTNPFAKLHILGTANTFRQSYDGTYYTDFSTGNSGNLTINPYGDSVTFGATSNPIALLPAENNTAGYTVGSSSYRWKSGYFVDGITTGLSSTTYGENGITSTYAGDFYITPGSNQNVIISTSGTGQVGIGTTNPQYPLDVRGGYANMVTGICLDDDCITSWSDGGVGQIYTAGNDLDLSGAQFNIESQLDYVSTINRTSSDLTLQTTTSGNIILNPVGNVGIGTTAPVSLLTVEGAVSLKETTAPSNTANYGKIYVKTSDSKLYFQDDGGTEFDLTAGGTGASKWTDLDSTTYLTSSDNVGIGTTNATFKLAVAGDLGPDADVAYSLGSAEKRWEDIYLGPGSVHMYNIYTDSTNYEQGYIGYEGVPETNATLDFDTADESTFSQEDLAYNATITPSAATGDITLTLGAGNWNDNAKVKKGMRVVGNGGIAEISADPAAQATITANVVDDFTNTDAIASGSWNLYGTNFANNLARISSYTQYATWNPSDKDAAITLSNGNLTATSANGIHKSVRATIGKSSGKWYWEYVAGAIATGGYSYLGVGTTAALLTTYVGNDDEGYSYCPQGNTWHGSASSGGVSTFVQNNVIGVAVDLDADKVWWSKNGTWQASGDPETGANGRYTGLSGTFYPMVGLYTTGNSVTANFGDSAFSYTPPTGFYSGVYADSYTSSSYYTIATTDSSQLDSSDWSAISTINLTSTLSAQTINYAISFDDRITWKIYDSASGDTGWRPIARNNSGTWQYNSNSTAGATDIAWTNATTNNQESAISEAQSVSANQMTGAELEAVTQSNWENSGGFSTTQTTLDFSMSFNTSDAETTPTLDQITVNYQGGPTSGIFTISSKAQGLGVVRDVQIRSGDNNQIYLSSSGNVGIGTQAPMGLFDVNNLFTVLSSGNVGVGTTSPAGLFDVNNLFTVLSSGNVGIGTTNPSGLFDINSKLTVLSSGNVGIGTTNPAYNLDILSSDTGAVQMLRIQNNIAAANGSGSEMLFGANRTTGGMSNIAGIKGIITDITNGSYDGSLMFSTAYNSSLTEKMAITNAGFVGVGITVPTGYFHVQIPTNMFSSSQHAFKFINTNSATSSYNAGMLIQGGGNSATVPELEIRDHSGNSDFWIGGTGNVGISTTAPTSLLQISSTANQDLFRIDDNGLNDTSPFIIKADGNVGIGISAPVGLLDVNRFLNVLSTGNVGIGTTNPGTKLAISGGLSVGTTSPTSSFLRALAPDGGAIFEGSVGIGTSDPQGLLEVRASSTCSSDYTSTGYTHYTDATQAGHTDGTMVSDNNTSTYIQTFTYVAIDYGVGNEKVVNKIRTYVLNSAARDSLKVGILYGSNDSTNGVDGTWTTLSSFSGLTVASGWDTTSFVNNTAYRWYKISGTPNNSNSVLNEWEMIYCESTSLVYTNSNKLGVGNAFPSTAVDVWDLGTAKSNLNILSLTNKANSADMNGTSTSILFNQFYYDASTPIMVDSGLISVGTETDWTSTASTQDSYMSFSTVLDGSMTERLRINSNGNVGIGTTNPGSLLALEGSVGSVLTLGSTTTDGTGRNRIFFSNNERAVFHGDDHSDQIFSFKSQFSNTRTNDAYIRVHGKASDSWDTYLSLGHDGSNGIISTDVGHILIDPVSGSNVGIGISVPSSMLHISSTAAQDLFRIDDNGAGDFSPFIIDTNGNVGVGVTNPTARLAISGTDNPEGLPFLEIKTGLITAGPDIQFNSHGLLASEIGMNFNIDSDNSGGGNFYFNRGSDTSSATNLMTINYDGNMGIGASSPTEKLEVTGNAYFRQSAVTAGIFLRTDATDTLPVNSSDAYIIKSGVSSGSYPFNSFGNLILQPATGTSRDIIFATREDDTNTNIRMVIKGDGDVGIGTTNPGSYKLYVNGTGYLNDTAWNYASDRRLKDEITPLPYGLDTINQLNPVSFVYKSNPNKTQLGFIAQEVREVIPEMIGKRPDGMLTLKTDLLIPILTKGLQEEHREVISIKGQVTNLGENINSLNDQSLTMEDKITLIKNSLFSATEILDKNQTDIETLKTQMEDLKLQNQSIIDFATALETDRLVYKDTLGNVNLLDGQLEAEGIVAGAFTIKIVDEEKKTIGEGEIKAVKKDDDLDGIDDETGSNGQEVEIKTKAVTSTSKIFITPQGDPGGYLWAEKKKSADTGEYTGFIIKVSNAVEKNTKIDWWMVEEE